MNGKKSIPKSIYHDLDPVYVMVSEDIINKDSVNTGARAINRFIENSVKTHAANIIAKLNEKTISTNGVFRITTNGHASFESNDRGRPDVRIEYKRF